MKKDKEWLKEEVNAQNIILDKGYIYTEDILKLIDQLEEPEQEKVVVTEDMFWEYMSEQYYFDKESFFEKLKEYNYLKKHSIVEKPVIPQFVADYIEKLREKNERDDYVIFAAYADYWEKEFKDKRMYKYIQEQNEFAKAILNGYKVEKEKRYYIRDKVRGATLMLFDLSDGGIEFVDGFSKEETLIFKEKEKAELIAKYVDGTAEEVME